MLQPLTMAVKSENFNTVWRFKWQPAKHCIHTTTCIYQRMQRTGKTRPAALRDFQCFSAGFYLRLKFLLVQAPLTLYCRGYHSICFNKQSLKCHLKLQVQKKKSRPVILPLPRQIQLLLLTLSSTYQAFLFPVNKPKPDHTLQDYMA